jgi:predicted acylesterase/phospholipase RssA
MGSAADNEWLLVDGVFKGGGAKGLAYAGALSAVEARRIWFRSVAGSSAGALTAALIAAGFRSDEMCLTAPVGLAKLRVNKVMWLWPLRASAAIFQTKRLHRWVELQLQRKVREFQGEEPEDPPVTFRELADRDDPIELNVVALDLATRQPFVFNQYTTPCCSVADAVLASCAIPIAMPAWRLQLTDANRTISVHRLVDGGAWSNYPMFIYRDESFVAKYIQRSDVNWGAPRPLGFILEQERLEPKKPDPDVDSFGGLAPINGEPPLTIDQQRNATRLVGTARRGSDRGSGRERGVFGALADWTVLRHVLFTIIPIAVAVVAGRWLAAQAGDYFPVVHELPDGIQYIAAMLVVVVTLGAIVVAVLAAIVNVRLAHELIDVGLPAVGAALSVGPGVPEWVGEDRANDKVIRLPLARSSKVGTTSFKLTNQRVQKLVDASFESATGQLRDLYPGRATGSAAPPRLEPSGRLKTLWRESRALFVFAGALLLAVVAAIVERVSALNLLDGPHGLILWLILIPGFWWWAFRQDRAPSGASPIKGTGRFFYAVQFVVGLALLCWLSSVIVWLFLKPDRSESWIVFTALVAVLAGVVILILGARLRARRLLAREPSVAAFFTLMFGVGLLLLTLPELDRITPLSDLDGAQPYELTVLDRQGKRIDFLDTSAIPSEVAARLSGGAYLRPCNDPILPKRCVVAEHDFEGVPVGDEVEVIITENGALHYVEETWRGQPNQMRITLSVALVLAVALVSWGVTDLWRLVASQLRAR